MADANTIFQHSYYIGNNFNAILYGTHPMRSSPFTLMYHRQPLMHAA